MRTWKAAAGSVLILGAVAVLVGGAERLSGAERARVVGHDGQRVVVEKQGPLALAKMLQGGVRLGVAVRDVTAADAAKLKLPAQAGVVVEQVEKESAAAAAGLAAGDVVVTYDGEAIRSVAQFTRLVRESVAGRAVKLTVVREGRKVDLTASPRDAGRDEMEIEIEKFAPGGRLPHLPEQDVLRERRFVIPHGADPEVRAMPFELDEPRTFRWFNKDGDTFMFETERGRGRLGVMVQDLTPDLAEFFGVKAGALVTTVEKDTPAAKAGVKAGDVIVSLDGAAVADSAALVEQLRTKSGEVQVSVMRDRKSLTLKATIEKPAPAKSKSGTPGVPTL